MRKLPKIPSTVFSVLGSVAVVEMAALPKEDGTGPGTDLGWWDGPQRTIRLRQDTHPTQKLHTLLHEKVHMWLWDSGAHAALTKEAEELICDTIATALLAEMLQV